MLLGKKTSFPGVRTSATSLQRWEQLLQPRCWAWVGVGSDSGSECVGREPMFTATDSASVGVRVSPVAEVPFCPTVPPEEVSVVTVRSRFLEMLCGNSEVSRALGCNRLGHLQKGMTGCLAGGN